MLKNFNFKILFWPLFFDVSGRFMQIFKKKKKIFKAPAIFWKLKLWRERARAQMCRFFGFVLLKIYYININFFLFKHFKKKFKNSKSLHPTALCSNDQHFCTGQEKKSFTRTTITFFLENILLSFKKQRIEDT